VPPLDIEKVSSQMPTMRIRQRIEEYRTHNGPHLSESCALGMAIGKE